MKRLVPKDPPEVLKSERARGWVRKHRKYKVITPLFGGGEETQKADSVTVVRATEVRGHLRFWWRATHGGMFKGNLAEMKQNEEAIWGSVAGKDKHGSSEVSVQIFGWKNGDLLDKQERDDKHIADPGADWGYVAFPLRREEDERGNETKSAGSVRTGVEFDMEISYPEHLKDDVEAALWAWETFGGIGARTRRGFGALQLDAKKLPTEKQWVKIEPPSRAQIHEEYLNKYLLEGGEWPAGVPHLQKGSQIKTSILQGTVDEVWKHLIVTLKSFRQQRYKDEYGLSQWHEANEIRRLKGREMRTPPEGSPKIKHVDRFPRAKLGLPIQFNLLHDKDLPQKIELHGRKITEEKSIDRLASPLILRPIACSDGAVGLALILEWEPVESAESYTPPGGLFLKGISKEPKEVKSDLAPDEATNILPLKGNTDILQVFLDSLT